VDQILDPKKFSILAAVRGVGFFAPDATFLTNDIERPVFRAKSANFKSCSTSVSFSLLQGPMRVLLFTVEHVLHVFLQTAISFFSRGS
jgi:hypothetical protein